MSLLNEKRRLHPEDLEGAEIRLREQTEEEGGGSDLTGLEKEVETINRTGKFDNYNGNCARLNSVDQFKSRIPIICRLPKT